MSDQVSSRHEGDLGGRFLPFGDTKLTGVTVIVAPSSVHAASTQHAAWMLVNLLARFVGVVRSIGLICPPSVPLAGRIIPLPPRNVDLRTALVAGVRSIKLVPMDLDLIHEQTIVVGWSGPGSTNANLHVAGNGWWGGYSSCVINDTGEFPSPLPFGPYAAACLGAAEIFKASRMAVGTYTRANAAFYSLWHHAVGESPITGGPSDVELVADAVLAGVGAVGSAALHTLWTMQKITGTMTLVDNDPAGVDLTNLNRYSLFGFESVGRQKAEEAARIAGGTSLTLMPVNGAIQEITSVPARILSAVDKNVARAAIQNRFASRILSASTLDLRAEVLRCGPPGRGACLRCYNVPEKSIADEDLREEFRNTPEAELSVPAAKAGISVQEAKEWLLSGKCGMAGERLLPFLRNASEPRAFAVGFTSVLAGVMLAGELVKDCIAAVAPLNDSQQRATFQFHAPLARTNRAAAYSRDPYCPMCEPLSVAVSFWSKRFAELEPRRS